MSDYTGESQSEFGILFINGFREQRPGSAVALFAATLYRWLFSWNAREAPSPALQPVLSEVQLSGAGGKGDEPAHLTLSAPLRLSTGNRDAQWLLAESSWADLFAAPRFLGLARWVWKVSTCLLVLQFVTPMHRHWQASQLESRRGRKAAAKALAAVYLVLMGAAAMLSVVQAALLMALALAAYLPIPRIDKAVRWIVVHISAMLGDTYMLAHCPVQFAAMRTHVADDLAWLQQHCKKVAVVAHSQGAALAHQILRDGAYRRDNLTAFITLGQAISKFDLLWLLDWEPQKRQQARRSRLLVTAGMCFAGLPAVLLLCHWADIAPAATALTSLPWWPLLLAAGFASIALGVHQAVTAVSANVRQKFGLPDATYTWSDYYASADPVSNGPLDHCPVGARQEPPGSGAPLVPCPCHEVYNTGSITFDHNGYLRNQDELLPSLLNDLVAAAYADEARPSERPELVRCRDIDDAKERRRRLVRRLVAVRVVALLLFAGVLWADPGRAVKHQMGQLAHLVKAPAAMASDLATRPLLAALITAVCYLVAVVAWQVAMRRATRRFFRDAKFPEPKPDACEPAGQPAMSGIA